MSMRQIAELVGCSKTTVSEALSGNPRVAEKTRQRVHEVARSLGYTPHGPARALALGKVGTIGVVPPFSELFYLGPWDSMIVSGLWKGCAQAGVSVVLLREEEPDQVPDMIARRLVDGAAFLIRPHQRISDYMRSRDIPMVTVDITAEGETDRVYPDDAQGVRLAIEHLVALGHRRIGYVNTFEPAKSAHGFSVACRLNSYLKVMAELGLRAPMGSDVCGSIEARVTQLLREEAPATALVCYDDLDAYQVIAALAKQGLRVPEDVSVVGIDDLEFDLWSHPKLTTVSVPFAQMGQEAARLLFERLENPALPPRLIVLPETLVVRESTAPPRDE